MDVAISDYFRHLGELGRRTEATDGSGRVLSLDGAVQRAVEMALAVKAAGSRVMFVGNGGSAGIASHMATDWLKNGGFAATCFNDPAALTCISNDLGYERVFALQLARHARKGDLLFAISSSGKSPNILSAVSEAKKHGVDVITFSGFESENPLRKLGALNFWLPDGHYGFVEIGHLALCHALLDIAMGWRKPGDLPVTMAAASV